MGPTNGQFLSAYSGQTTAQLLAMAPQYRVDSIVLAFEQALDAKTAGANAIALTQAERTILAVEALEREVNNGGYSLFFINSSKEYAADVVPALERIACRKTARITANAIQAL